MKVSELKVGELYKIRSDRPMHVMMHSGRLDVHVGTGEFAKGARVRPMDHIVYLGIRDSWRHVMYRGKEMSVWPNVWRHVVPLESE